MHCQFTQNLYFLYICLLQHVSANMCIHGHCFSSFILSGLSSPGRLTRPGPSGAAQPGLPISMFDQSCHYGCLSHPYSVSTSISRA